MYLNSIHELCCLQCEGDELQSTHVPSPSAWTTTLVEYGEPIGGIGAKFGCGLHGDRCCFGASRQHRQLVIEACQIQPDHNAVMTLLHGEFARFRRPQIARASGRESGWKYV